MRFAIPSLAFVALCLGSAQANAASCSSFAVIKSYDAEASAVEIAYEKGNERKYFPKPEGTPRGSSKIPSKCRKKVTRNTSFGVKATGGKLTLTQVRSNFEGRMLNDLEDPSWLSAKLQQLIADETTVVVVIRPGPKKDSPANLTTIYLPITDEERVEIKRIEDLAEDT